MTALRSTMLLTQWLLCAYTLLFCPRCGHYPVFGIHNFTDSFIYVYLCHSVHVPGYTVPCLLLLFAVLGQHYVHDNHPYLQDNPSSSSLLYKDNLYNLLVALSAFSQFNIKLLLPILLCTHIVSSEYKLRGGGAGL